MANKLRKSVINSFLKQIYTGKDVLFMQS